MKDLGGVTDWPGFEALLSSRIDAYFASTGRRPAGGPAVTAKLVLGGIYFAGTYALMLLAPGASVWFMLAYVLHGTAHLFMVLNIGHDANHGSLLSGRRANRLFAHAMDLCGISSRIWRITHHRFHHYTMNIEGEDEAVCGRGALRFTPHAERRALHRFQHLYAPFTYFLVSIVWVFVKDFKFTFGRHPDGFPVERAGGMQAAKLIALKLLYLGYMIAVPAAWFGHPLAAVLAAFLISHMIIGMSAVFLFQTAHVIEGSRFYLPGERPADHVRFTFETTVDCAAESRLLAALAGGLNTHVIHHLYPRICHVHYRRLTRIMNECALASGVPYRRYGHVLTPFAKHLRLMRQLAGPD